VIKLERAAAAIAVPSRSVDVEVGGELNARARARGGSDDAGRGGRSRAVVLLVELKLRDYSVRARRWIAVILASARVSRPAS
jgi:hypothetical protein